MNNDKSAGPGILFGCGVFVASITVAVSAIGTATADSAIGDISRGAASWSDNCSRCHEMRDPTEFRDDLWRPIVTHMRVRAGLTGQQQRDILAFLQASNNPPRESSVTATVDKTVGVSLTGKQIYDQTCIACHGEEGAGGMPGVPDFTVADGPLSKSDDTLAKSILNGFRSPGSPLAMPAKGGNPNLTDSDVDTVLGYLRERFGR